MKRIFILVFILISSGCATSQKEILEMSNRASYESLNINHRKNSNYVSEKTTTIYMSKRVLDSNDLFYGGYIDIILKDGGWR